MQEIALAETRLYRNEQSHGHPRQRGVDARIVEQSPYRYGRNEIENHPLLAHAVHRIDQGHDQQRCRQIVPMQLSAVEKCNYQDRPQIIDHSQRRKENLQRNGNPVTQHRENSHRESDIGRSRNPPARTRRSAGIERQIDQRGHQHTAHRGQHRKNRPAKRGEMPA